MVQAANYISQHALDVKSVYVRAVATYALTYFDLDNEIASQLFDSLKNMALEKGCVCVCVCVCVREGLWPCVTRFVSVCYDSLFTYVCTYTGNPVEQRYWQESKVAEWLKPDESSGLTVETTAYVLLTAVLKVHLTFKRPSSDVLGTEHSCWSPFWSTLNLNWSSLKVGVCLHQANPHLADPGPALWRRLLFHTGTEMHTEWRGPWPVSVFASPSTGLSVFVPACISNCPTVCLCIITMVSLWVFPLFAFSSLVCLFFAALSLLFCLSLLVCVSVPTHCPICLSLCGPRT